MLLADANSVTLVQSIGQLLHQLFGGDVPDEPLELYQIVARAVVVYLAGLAIVRIGKSRIISRTTVVDVIVGFILGSLLSRGITGHASISGTLVASVTVVVMHWLFTALATRYHIVGKMLKGNANLVVQDGKLLEDNMRGSNISDNDLAQHMRLAGIGDLEQVREAYKERNGEISFIKRDRPPHVIDVAVQDGVQTVRIALM